MPDENGPRENPPPARAVTAATFLIALGIMVLTVIAFTRRAREKGVPDAEPRPDLLVAGFRKAILEGDETGAERAYEVMKGMAPAAVAPASRLFDDPDGRVRAGAAELVQELVEGIREQDPDASPGVEVRQAIPLLVRGLSDGDERVRSEAASALGWIGPEAEAAIPDLERAAGDPSERVRDKSARALERIRTGVLEPRSP